MRVFISWSGEHSKQVAIALKDWLPMVIQAVKPWVSVTDIEKGDTWFSSIQKSLTDAKGMGIFCLTPDNLIAPWLAFEAGALSAHDRGRVATFLHRVDATSVKPPLSLFQATKASEKTEVLGLLKSINDQVEDPLEPGLLQRAFDANWDALNKAMNAIVELPNEVANARKTSDEMLEEILTTVRRLERDTSSESDRKLRHVIARFTGPTGPVPQFTMADHERLQDEYTIPGALTLAYMEQLSRLASNPGVPLKTLMEGAASVKQPTDTPKIS